MERSRRELHGFTSSPTVPGAPFAVSLLALLALVRRRRAKRAALGNPAEGRTARARASALLLFASSRARADGANSDRYTAPAAPEDLLWSERASPPVETLRPFVRVSASFADDPLVLENENTSREVALIDEQFRISFLGGSSARRGGSSRRCSCPFTSSRPLPSRASPSPTKAVSATPASMSASPRLNRENPVELALAATLRVPDRKQ